MRGGLMKTMIGWAILLMCSVNLFAQGELDFSKVRLKFSVRVARDASKTAMDSLTGVLKLRPNGEVRLRLSIADVMRVDSERRDSLYIYFVTNKSKQVMTCQEADILNPSLSSASMMRTVYRLDSVILKPKKSLLRVKWKDPEEEVAKLYCVYDTVFCNLHYQDKNLVEHVVTLNNKDSVNFPAPIYRLGKLSLINHFDSTEVKSGPYYLVSGTTGRRLGTSRTGDLGEFNKKNIQTAAASKTMSTPVIKFESEYVTQMLPKIYIKNWPFDEVVEEGKEETE